MGLNFFQHYMFTNELIMKFKDTELTENKLDRNKLAGNNNYFDKNDMINNAPIILLK